MMTILSLVCVVVGLALVALGAWERAGRSRNARAWTRARTERAWRNAMFTRPGLGVVLLVLGVFGVARDVPVLAEVLAAVAIVALVVTFAWGILALPCPGWAVPGFARERWQQVKEQRWS